MRRAFKFRAYPNTGTRRRLWNAMRRAATPVWNACVAEREESRKAYAAKLDDAFSDFAREHKRDLTEKEEKAIRSRIAKSHHWPSAYDQYKHVRKSDHPEYAAYSSSMMECTVAKVDGSEKSFRALWLKGHADARPPRQTNLHRCLTFRKSGWKLNGDRLELFGIGSVKVRLHREIQGKVKTVSVTEKNGKWFVCFSCELTTFSGVCGPVPAPKSFVRNDLQQKYTSTVGGDPDLGGTHNESAEILRQSLVGGDPDFGGTHNGSSPVSAWRRVGGDPDLGRVVTLYFSPDWFCADSVGRIVLHPEFYCSEIDTLRRLSRSLSRKHKAKPGERADGSYRGRNRRRARRLLAKWHDHIAAKRDHFLWAWARYYAANFQQVIVPAWPLKQKIQYSVESRTAMRLLDGAYGKFLAMLKQKCEEFGSELVIRKDEEQWQKEVESLTEVARMEALGPILRKAKRALKSQSPNRLRSLARACETVATLHA